MRISSRIPLAAAVFALVAAAPAGAAGIQRGEVTPVRIGAKPSPVATAAAAKKRIHGGATGLGDPIVFRANRKRKVQSGVFTFTVNCPSGRAYPVSGGPSVVPDPGGDEIPFDVLVALKNRRGEFNLFLASAIQPEGDLRPLLTMSVAGKLRRRGGSGTFQADVEIIDGAGQTVERCTTGELDWSTRRGRRIYGGETEAGQPVVVKLNASRSRVALFRFGWFSNDCTPPGGFVRAGDGLTNFPLSGSGGFGDTFTLTFPQDDGSTDAYDYFIDGDLDGRRASGAFAVTFTETAPDGGQASCRVPETSWAARSG